MSAYKQRTILVVTALSLALASGALGARTRIVVEAEKCQTITPKLEKAKDPKASGGEVILVKLNRPHGTGVKYVVEGEAKYVINVPSAGRYYFWGFVAWYDACGNSFNIKVDDNPPVTLEGPVTDEDKWAWRWQKLKQSFQLTAGKHTILVQMAEDGPKMDQWLLTNDKRFIPVRALKPTPQYLVPKQ